MVITAWWETIRIVVSLMLDLELGWNIPFLKDHTDSTRVYAGGYHFEGNLAEDVSGWRTRIASDITSNIEIGARFQRDDVRGVQGFLEATIRFPFGNKKSYRQDGLYARLDESPERDIDIVSNQFVVDDGSNQVLLNGTTGVSQNVLIVDNTAAGGGDGSAETPFNTLASAEAAAVDNDLIYVRRGDGTTTGLDSGITLDDPGQMLVGSGTNLNFSGAGFTTENGQSLSSETVIAADPLGAPVITNGAGDGVLIRESNISVSGITVDGASGRGVYAHNDFGTVWDTINISDVFSTNNGDRGIRVSTFNPGSTIENVNVNNVISTQNGNQGFFFLSNVNSQMSNINVRNIQSENNGTHGLMFQQTNAGVMSKITVQNATINNNTSEGLWLLQQDTSQLSQIVVENTTVSGNGANGLRINGTATGVFVPDFGGGTFGGIGNNRVFANTGNEIRLDFEQVDTFKAENNWWGSATGLNLGDTLLLNGGIIDASPFLIVDPNL